MPGARYFIVLLYTAILYCGAYIGEINSHQLGTAKIWFHIEHLAIPLQHYIWVMMGLDYVRISKRYYSFLKYGLLYHPILYYLVYFTDLHSLYISSYRFESNGFFNIVATTKGCMYAAIVVSGTMLGILSTSLYLKGYIKSSRNQRQGYLIMIIASLFPWTSVYLTATNNSFLGIDYYPVTNIVSGAFYMYGIFSLRIFNTIPIATEMVFKHSSEAILLIDSTDRMIDANLAMIDMYPELSRLTKSSTIQNFIERHQELAKILDGEEMFDTQIGLGTTEKYYIVKISYIETEEGLWIGKIITMSDVTKEYEYQKLLESIAATAIDKAETSEISFLQAQISPHFINNTLSVIASMITRAPDEAKCLITNLGEYLASRYYFDSESPMVLLEHEIGTVQTYVNIENARFRERLHFHIMSDRIPGVYIPRLILQPLVENAIRHGILKKAEGGNVWLSIDAREDRIYFEVKDDGIGMDQDKVLSLKIMDSRRNSIGITNIHKRLEKYYGEGLTINSVVGEGTTISFSILSEKLQYKRFGGEQK
jgi:two-component system LytT family sensor kinase